MTTSGRPKKHHEPLVTTTVRLPKSMTERLHDEADRRIVGRSYLVQLALTDLFAKLDALAGEAGK